MSNIVSLKAASRHEVGTQQVKRLRLKKLIPAIVYGTGFETLSIQVAADDFHRVLHTKAGENVVIGLEVSGETRLEKTVIIKELQHDPVTDNIRHIDFLAISLTEKIKVMVPMVVVGEAPGMKQGGVLDLVHHEIEVECLPTNIPSRLEVDISKMEIGDAIHVNEISFPSGVKSELPDDEVVVAVHAPKAEEVPAAEEGAAAAEPELVGKEKKEGEEAGAEPSGAATPESQPKKEKES